MLSTTVMLYCVAEEATEGVPLIAPLLLKLNPTGNVGVILNDKPPSPPLALTGLTAGLIKTDLIKDTTPVSNIVTNGLGGLTVKVKGCVL